MYTVPFALVFYYQSGMGKRRAVDCVMSSQIQQTQRSVWPPDTLREVSAGVGILLSVLRGVWTTLWM